MCSEFDRVDANEFAMIYRRQLVVENHAMRELVNVRENLEREKTKAIAEAYAKDLISGKNAEERANQIAYGLQGVIDIQCLEAYVENAERNLQQAEIDRKAIEIEISLTKAWLYSQSGAGK